jgi:hypothetical protein
MITTCTPIEVCERPSEFGIGVPPGGLEPPTVGLKDRLVVVTDPPEIAI